jgi:Flp pilus assembly protein TadD
MTPWLLLLLAAVAPSGETPAAREQARACLAAGAAAVPACRRALELGLRPQRAAVVNGILATRLVADGRWDEAAAALEEWCRLAPADPDVLLFGLGDPDAAASRLREAAALATPDASLLGALGSALAAAHRYAEATQAFDQAVALEADFFDLRPAAKAVAEAARRQASWP